MNLYKLDGKLAVPVDTIEEWYKGLNFGKHVALEEIGGYVISTVFLGVDHGFFPDRPLLFETMIFDPGGRNDYQERCGTWEEAIEMHEAAVAEVIGRL